MTEATPPPEEKKEGQPRDAAYWAKRVERLEVSEVPAGATNVNVHGRHEVGALQGFGQLWQKTYRVRLTGADVTPDEVVKVWKEHFPEFQPPNSRFYPSMAGVAPGEVLFISASVGGLPVHTGVRVIYADDESFTLMTPEGHPESGWNTFSAYWDDDGTTIAQIQSLARQRPYLRDRLPHCRLYDARADLDPCPQGARRTFRCGRTGKPGEGLCGSEVTVVASEVRLAKRGCPIHALHDGWPGASYAQPDTARTSR
ncbi:MAG: DUF1990 domain-containing protein [Actinomycetota bacterium]|nr:DUF1990 domain-containing protein [Actinomycetota bacterium]